MMIISLRKIILPSVLVAALLIVLGLLTFKMVARNKRPSALMGGVIHTVFMPTNVQTEIAEDSDSSRFQRPSAQPALKNKYSFPDFYESWNNKPRSLDNFQTSEDVILAYFGILREAANMGDYSGGCGTVGWAILPYPYAYDLLSSGRRKNMSLTRFEDSFKGVGQLTLLKLYPAYTPPGTPGNIRYHMVEAEAITGAASDEPASFRSGSHFAYFYGIITTEEDKNIGWKIKAIDYFPEDFLCAPTHGWEYDSKYLVPFVYQNWYHMIDKVNKTEQNGDMISTYASGSGKQYRFDFVRITNGEDVLLHEMVSKNGKWVETNLLKDRDQVLKLSVLNPNLERG